MPFGEYYLLGRGVKKEILTYKSIAYSKQHFTSIEKTRYEKHVTRKRHYSAKCL